MSRPVQGSRGGGGANPKKPPTGVLPPATEEPMEKPVSRAHTREQERAKLAWDWVQEAAKALDKAKAAPRYGTLTKKLPTYLYTNGFEQTMAFLFSKAEKSDRKPAGLLFARLAQHTLRSLREAPPLLAEGASISQMMDAIVKLNVEQSRRASHEATCIAQWLHRFGAAELGEEE